MSAASNARSRWINGDERFLRSIAQELLSDNVPNILSAQERSAIHDASQSDSSWTAFLNVEDEHKWSPEKRTEGESDDRELDARTALFRSRYLLYENSITSDIYTDHQFEDFCLVSPYVVSEKSGQLERTENAEAARSAAATAREAEDDDDYDDVEPAEGSISAELEQNLELLSEQTDGMRPNGSSKPGAEMDTTTNEDSVLDYTLRTLYHTLDSDRDAMLEQSKLDASDRQVEVESGPVEREKLSAVNFGAANLSLKHLLSTIEAKREALAMSDSELRNLLSEVRKNRSKWANEDKIGQEELYEAAEKVVLELRGYTEHSTPFLNKVTKRDVPDYHNVIKNPMDLGTVMKNLKNLVYRTKASFVHDLMLIWENCLTYNADQAHPIRKHAYAMRRKTDQLVGMMPDITIRDRTEVDMDEDGMNDADDQDSEDETKPIMSSRGTFGQKSKKSKTSKTTNKTRPPEHSFSTEVDAQLNGQHDSEITPEPSLLETKAVAQAITEEMEAEVPEMNGSEYGESDNTDQFYQVWRTRTNKTRANYATQRHRSLRGCTIASEDLVLSRNSFLMGDFMAAGKPYLGLPTAGVQMKSEESETKQTSNGMSHVLAPLHNSGKPDDLRLQEYEICSGVPEIYGRAEYVPDSQRRIEVENPEFFEPPIGGTIVKMTKNLLQMKDIRKLCTKIGALRLMQEPTMSAFPASYFRSIMESDVSLKFEHVEVTKQSYDSVPCGEYLARSLLLQTSSQLLYAAGFEDFHAQALDAFLEVAADYILILGKTAKTYIESEMDCSVEEVVRHTLHETGTPDLAYLENYILEDIEKQGDRLDGLKVRLQSFLHNFLNGTIESGDGSNLFDEKSDAFVTGNFTEETGDDFFGFKELGLDKEFGMSTLSVPLRLLQGRLKTNAGSVTVTDSSSVPVELRFDHKFPPITNKSIANEIGLIQPFLRLKLEEQAGANEAKDDDDDDDDDDDENLELLEDEDLPIRQRKPKPRLPPSGKILAAQKRPLSMSSNISPKKKKKTTELPKDPGTPTKDRETTE